MLLGMLAAEIAKFMPELLTELAFYYIDNNIFCL